MLELAGPGEEAWPFFLEWERRAVQPSTMDAHLAPCLRDYASQRPTDDHGVRPQSSSATILPPITSSASPKRRSPAAASICRCGSRTEFGRATDRLDEFLEPLTGMVTPTFLLDRAREAFATADGKSSGSIKVRLVPS